MLRVLSSVMFKFCLKAIYGLCMDCVVTQLVPVLDDSRCKKPRPYSPSVLCHQLEVMSSCPLVVGYFQHVFVLTVRTSCVSVECINAMNDFERLYDVKGTCVN